jgi:cytoskeletal protein RodZ
MGREVRGLPEAAPLTDAAGPPAKRHAREREVSIGAYLARQRRLRGISVAELAELTKIPIRSIQRMESGAFDRNPDGFVRGFVRAVAVALGLDPEETVMRMRGEPADSAEAAHPRSVRHDRRWVVISGLLAATLGLGFAIWGWVSHAPREAAGKATPKLVYRRDAVRALADEQAHRERTPPSDAGGSEPVGSPGEQHPH